jgi:hypothetical protein
VNSTDTYLSVDDQSLQNYAYNIVTWGGDREAPPGLRGSDIEIPYQPGATWAPKVVGSRTITMSMWVIGANDDGSAPATGSRRALFEKNFKALRKLLWTPERQIRLTKRFRLFGSSTVISATALAQFAGGINPVMGGTASARFTVDLNLADPYFYGSQKTVNLAASQVLNILGDANTRDIELVIAGSRQNVIVRNNTLDLEVRYNSSLLTGATATLKVKDYTALTSPGSGQPAFKSVGFVRHSGNPSWLLLRPGDNNITATSQSGTGAVTMRYREAWL